MKLEEGKIYLFCNGVFNTKLPIILEVGVDDEEIAYIVVNADKEGWLYSFIRALHPCDPFHLTKNSNLRAEYYKALEKKNEKI